MDPAAEALGAAADAVDAADPADRAELMAAPTRRTVPT